MANDRLGPVLAGTGWIRCVLDWGGHDDHKQTDTFSTIAQVPSAFAKAGQGHTTHAGYAPQANDRCSAWHR